MSIFTKHENNEYFLNFLEIPLKVEIYLYVTSYFYISDVQILHQIDL